MIPENESQAAGEAADNATAEIDERWIDQLVDGELSPADQRALLLRMEFQPASWRRLALAFVEAQAWSRDLSGVLKPATVSTTSPPTPAKLPHPIWVWPVAAACCVGVSVGTWLAFNQFHKPASSTSVQTASTSRPARIEVRNASNGTDTSANTLVGPSLKSVSRNSKHGASLRVQVDDQGHTIDIPLLDAADVNPDWLRGTSVKNPADVPQAIRDSGQDVRTIRRLVPFQLKDGRWGVMPVDEVEVLPKRATK